jgi:MYXO-CTERM domain-containing protein
MSKRSLILGGIISGGLAIAMSSGSASAAALMYEPFDYTAPQRVLGRSNANTGTTWLLAASSGAGGDTTAINVASGSLSMPSGMPAAVGNSATIAGAGNLNGAANRLAFDSSGTSVTSGTVYYSLALRIDDVDEAGTANGFFIGLNNTGNSATGTNPSAVAARIQARVDPTDSTKYNLGITRNRATTVTDIPWSGPLTVGQTLFVVASIEIVSGTQNDVARLWINPAASATPPSPTLADDTVGIGTAGTDIGIASIILRQSPAPFVSLDELRVGTAWEDVAPVPEPMGLAGVAGLGLLATRRRRHRRA